MSPSFTTSPEYCPVTALRYESSSRSVSASGGFGCFTFAHSGRSSNMHQYSVQCSPPAFQNIGLVSELTQFSPECPLYMPGRSTVKPGRSSENEPSGKLNVSHCR